MLGKSLQAAVAGQATGGATYVEDVFSTYLYTGNGSSQVIENGIRLGDSNAGGSVYFDGSGDGLQIANSSNFNISSGDFTLEAWIYPTTYTASYQAIVDIEDASISNYSNVQFRIWLSSTGSILVDAGSSSTGTGSPAVSISGGSAPQNTWTHIAATRNGNTFTLWVNGTSVGTQSFSGSFYWDTNKLLYIGYGQNASYLFNGNISNLRLVKGSAVYTAGFTPPTSALTAVTNTQLLTCQGDTPFTDNSTNGFTITQNGNVAAKSFGPFTSDVAGEGGLVWIKERTVGYNHVLFDTNRGGTYRLGTQDSDAQVSGAASYGYIPSFNSDGFSVAPGSSGAQHVSASGSTYASWTFRKAPKFFDVVTYTGTGSARTVAHNLGSVPGCIIVKSTSNAYDWAVYHRGTDSSSPQNWKLRLNATDSRTSDSSWNNTAPTDTEFSLGSLSEVNLNGGTYVAYLFAHDAGGFGDAGDQSVIKCGSYTGTETPQTIDLGWEPQWLLIKTTTISGPSWYLFDNMRGITTGGNDVGLFPNLSSAESSGAWVDLTATGFTLTTGINAINNGGDGYIYIAIRRGPMKTPTDGTSVFAASTYTGTGAEQKITSGLQGAGQSFVIVQNRSGNNAASRVYDALRGPYREIYTPVTNAEVDRTSISAGLKSFDMDGFTFGPYNYNGTNESGTTYVAWQFNRAPGFFDVVAYTGNGVDGTVLNHNLGVTPELVIVKQRNTAKDWYVNVFSLNSPNTGYLNDWGNFWSNSKVRTPTSTTVTLGTGGAEETNGSGGTYIMYLFASIPGVSKVGKFTGNGSTQTINCGFSNGARFVLIKRTDANGDWHVFDTARGIVAGSDPYLELNTTNAEVTSEDAVDPVSSGFAVNEVSGSNINTSSATYIYLAIA